MKPFSYGLLFATLFALTAACGGDDDEADGAGAGAGGGPGAGGSGQSGPAANCPGRCSTKATACMMPANLVDPYCQQLCGASPTESQMSCLEGKSCQELMNGGQNPLSLCPAGTPGGGGSGGGGAGPGGAGSGGSGAGAIPDTVTVSGKRRPGNMPIQVPNTEMTELSSTLSANADVTYSYADVRGNVDLQKAASKAVTSPSSPAASDCAGIASIGVTLNASTFGYVFTGVDVLPASGCADFADAVHQQGLTMRFTDVPVLNSSSKIKEVIVDIDP